MIDTGGPDAGPQSDGEFSAFQMADDLAFETGSGEPAEHRVVGKAEAGVLGYELGVDWLAAAVRR